MAAAEAAGCGGEVEVTEGAPGAAGQAVAYGCPDNGSESCDVEAGLDFPYVVSLNTTDQFGQPHHCTGTLISPGLVLTAAHCVLGGWCNLGAFQIGPGIFNAELTDWEVKFGYDPQAAVYTTGHTYASVHAGETFHHHVESRPDFSLDFCDRNDPSRDLAVLRLDRRVPTFHPVFSELGDVVVPAIAPMHVPVDGRYLGCAWIAQSADGMAAHVVGHGDCDGMGVVPPPGTPAAPPCVGGRRNYNASVLGWTYEDEMPNPFIPNLANPACPFFSKDIDGAVYRNDWNEVQWDFGGYNGMMEGDSGGPLISEFKNPLLEIGAQPNILGNPDGRMLCGVASRTYPVLPGEVPTDACYMGIAWGNDYAAVDEPANAIWLAQQVLAHGLEGGDYIGECLNSGFDPKLEDQDSDDDLIPDACDICPHNYDADYGSGVMGAAQQDCEPGNNATDYDCDGVPDRCDNCPTVMNGLSAHEVDVVPATGLCPNGTQAPCWVRDQQDSDQDGYGDACDTCPGTDEVDVPTPTAADPLPPFTDYACCTTDDDCGPPDCTDVDPEALSLPPAYAPRCFPRDSRGTLIDRLTADPDGDGPGTGFTVTPCEGHCAMPVDFDCDVHGDLCDNCPPVVGGATSNITQADADGDGVGDRCDNCPAIGSFHYEDINPECDYFHDGDASCALLQPGSVCLPPKGDIAPSDVGRCSLFTDADGDGLGDPCDNCVNTANPGFPQKNCNLVQELVTGVPYPYVGDACDRNPCSSFLPTAAIQSLAEEAAHGFVEQIEYSPKLLPSWHPGEYYGPAFQTPSHFVGHKATTGLRLCPCETPGPDGNPHAIACQNEGCLVNSGEYGVSVAWRVPHTWPTLVTQTPPKYNWPGAETAGQPVINSVPGNTWAFLLPESSPSTSTTYWYLQPDIDILDPGATQLSGILWSHVTHVTNLVPMAGQPAALVYFPWSNHHRGGVFGKPPAEAWPALPPIAITPYFPPPCDPLKASLPDVSALAIAPGGGHLALRSVTGDLEVASVFSPSAKETLATDSVRWVAAAEPVLGAGALRLASISNDGRASAGAIHEHGGSLTRWSPTEILGPIASPVPGSGPKARADFGAVLSATEEAIFVVGGRDATTGELRGDVWRYHVPSFRWTRLPVHGPRPAVVLAATYRSEEGALYAVDEVDTNGAPRARLLRLDLSTGESNVLGQWPRTKKLDRVYLANTDDGKLLLVGSSTSQVRYVGGAFDPDSDLSLPLPLSFHGKGIAILPPTLRESGLTVTVESGGAIQNRFVSRKKLFEHPGNQNVASFL